MSVFPKLLIYSIVILGSLACGQKNDLYLPAPEQTQQPAEGVLGEVSEETSEQSKQ